MKINPTLPLTLVLVGMMSGTGAVSAFWGLKAGHEALKGVSQPEVNPSQKLAEKSSSDGLPAEFTPVDEKSIIAKVQERIKSQTASGKASEKKPAGNPPKASQKEKASQSPAAAALPISARDGGVTLTVEEVSQEGGYLTLAVTLKNQGSKSIHFLYSFLEVKGEGGTPLSAMAEGLPAELPANGEPFAGTIEIPLGLLGEERSLSLNLTDHPEQTLKLALAGIPTTRSESAAGEP